MKERNVNDNLVAVATATDGDPGDSLTFDFRWYDQTAPSPTTPIREALDVPTSSPSPGVFVATDTLPASFTTVGQVIKLSFTPKDSSGLIGAALEMPIRIVGNAPVAVSLTVE